MTKLEKFRKVWAGRIFKCPETGIVNSIPDCVNQCDFFIIGKGFLDVGRFNAYSRRGGNVYEVTGEGV